MSFYKLQHLCCCRILYSTFMWKFIFAFQDGFKTSHPFNILVRSQHNLLFLWSSFKYIGDNHYFQIDATSKEIMLFHDHSF